MAIYGPLTFDVTVSGGTGSFTFDGGGYYILAICVKAPSASHSYQYEMLDADGFPIAGTRVAMTGNDVQRGRIEPVGTGNTFTFSGATDGNYSVRFRCDTF